MGDHRVDDARGYLFPAPRRRSEPRIRARHAIEGQPEHNRAAAVNRQVQLRRAHVRPQCYVVQDRLLHRMLDALVAFDRPAAAPGVGEHCSVLSRAVVMSALSAAAGLAKNLRAPRCERLLWPARQVTLLEPDIRQHLLDERDMLGLAAVRAAGNRELLVT